MAKLRLVVVCSFLTVLGSVLVSFLLASVAYSLSGSDSVFSNALSLATTGGFSDAPLDGSWRVVVLIPCTVCRLAGCVFLFTSVPFIVFRTVQIALGLFGKKIDARCRR